MAHNPLRSSKANSCVNILTHPKLPGSSSQVELVSAVSFQRLAYHRHLFPFYIQTMTTAGNGERLEDYEHIANQDGLAHEVC
jgi:hypothetical protein